MYLFYHFPYCLLFVHDRSIYCPYLILTGYLIFSHSNQSTAKKIALYITSVLSLPCTHFVLTQDTGISVRKRVIKIMRDICLEQPDFHKITEMCVKMIRRVNDEEGIKVCVCFNVNSAFQCQFFVFSIQCVYIYTTYFPMQKLVNETFQKLWFTPTPSHDKDAMTRKILNITDVVRTI